MLHLILNLLHLNLNLLHLILNLLHPKPEPVAPKPEPVTIKKPTESTISNNNRNTLSKITNPTELKKQYRKLALQYHPDKNQSQGSKERFQNLDAIYKNLQIKFPNAQF